MERLPLTFEGTGYPSASAERCWECNQLIRYAWVIWDNSTDTRVKLCERHYKRWEAARSDALLALADQFRNQYELATSHEDVVADIIAEEEMK